MGGKNLFIKLILNLCSHSFRALQGLRSLWWVLGGSGKAPGHVEAIDSTAVEWEMAREISFFFCW